MLDELKAKLGHRINLICAQKGLRMEAYMYGLANKSNGGSSETHDRNVPHPGQRT